MANKLDRVVADEFILQVSRGMPMVDAANVAGASYRWIRKSRARAEKVEKHGKSAVVGGHHDLDWDVQFYRDTEEARSRSVAGPLACLADHASIDPNVALKFLANMRYEFNPANQRLAKEKIQEMYRIAKERDPELARKLKKLAEEAGVL